MEQIIKNRRNNRYYRVHSHSGNSFQQAFRPPWIIFSLWSLHLLERRLVRRNEPLGIIQKIPIIKREVKILSETSNEASATGKEKPDLKGWIGFGIAILGFILAVCVYVSHQRATQLACHDQPSIISVGGASNGATDPCEI